MASLSAVPRSLVDDAGAEPLPVSIDTDAHIKTQLPRSTHVAIITLALIAGASALYFARAFFLPIALALVISLTLSPLVHWARKYARLPPALSAALLIVGLGLGVAGALYAVSTPFTTLMSDAPNLGRQVQDKLAALRAPMDALTEAGASIDNAVGDDDNGVREVVVQQPGLIARAASSAQAVVTTALVTIVLTFFLLISRELFLRKVIRVMPTLRDRKAALGTALEIEHDVSRYLLTVAAINAMLGLAVGVAFALLGMPDPFMWGVIAALLNFLPYVGSLLGIALAGAVAIVTMPTLGSALLIPAAYFAVTTAEGQFVTPMVMGRRFSLNTVVILVSIAFWGFLWGPAGVFVAVPFLIAFKVFCERADGLSSLNEFLSGAEEEEPQGNGNGSTASAATA